MFILVKYEKNQLTDLKTVKNAKNKIITQSNIGGVRFKLAWKIT